MDTYPCPACGGVATPTDGCQGCGREHDPVAAALARVNQAMAGLADESRQLDEDQRELRQRRARLQAERAALTTAITRRLTDERQGTRVTTSTTAGAAPPRRRVPGQRCAPPPLPPHVQLPETSPRSAQNTLLTLGGVLLGIAAVVVAGVYYTTTATGGRAVILGIATTLFLGMPVLLARGRLTATAETIAAIGLLLLLLDGYTAYSADLARIRAVPPALYAAILFALVTGVAGAYRFATHLRAPQFAALLAVQPLLPLLAVNFALDRDGFAAVFAVVAAFNLGAVVLFGTEIRLLAAGRLRLAGRSLAPAGTGTGWPGMLRELAWFLFGATLAASAGLAVARLAGARTLAHAMPPFLAVVLAAAVGVAAGQISGRERMRLLAGGAATLAIIGALARVNFLALPHYTLVLTAAVAAAVAIGAGFLPEAVRAGPRWGSLVGAAFAAMVVLAGTAATVAATIRAATTPRVWAADLAEFTQRVQSPDWQVPVTALLLAIVAAAASPASWRVDALVLGGAVVVLAAPGTGGVEWWAVAVLGVLASTAATTTSLYATRGREALIRSGTAGLLGLDAVATSLARPALTAAVAAVLALVAAATIALIAGWPHRFGPYGDRVADSAGGAAAFTLPIAAGTYAWMAHAPSAVLVPITLLATAAGALGAAISQVAAREPRTASAGGALAAAVGCLLLSIQLPGAAAADIGLSVLLLGATVATAASRAFEVSAGGLVEGVESVPAAVGALVDAVEGETDRPERRTPRVPRVNSTILGAALAAACLVLALARLLAAAVPGIGLVTTMAMVLLTALGLRTLPERWRRGPRLGATVVGGAIGLITTAVAIAEGARTLAASTPFWAADLTGWPGRVAAWTPYGWQVPATLLLGAVAAWVLLPAPAGGDLAFVTLALAGLSAPATLGLAWWSPILIMGGLAVVAGLGAATLGPPGMRRDDPASPAVHRRLGLALLLGLYAAAASGATPAATGALLSGLVAAGVLVAAIANLRAALPVVAGTATATALAAAPGAAATVAASSGAAAAGVLGSALIVAAFGVPVAWALRSSGARWGSGPGFGVGVAALIIAAAAVRALPSLGDAQVWAAAAALVAAGAAAGLRTRRESAAVIAVTVLPTGALAAIASAPAWLATLVGPYRTLRQVWAGYASAPHPVGAPAALATLLLLTLVAGVVALSLGGPRYLLAAILPPLAAAALVVPAALGATPAVTPWVALAVALVTGLGAALSPPTLPAAARMLRGTAGLVCAVAGGAGFAGSLATRASTLAALGLVVLAAGIAATAGRDSGVRMVAWFVAAAASFALPVVVLAAAGRDVRPAAFAVLAICAGLVTAAWWLARISLRRAEAAVVELCAAIGATFALLLTLSSARNAAAVLTIWGLLLGAAALRRDRSASRRHWLVRAAMAAEVGACWLLLYSVEVGLPEAYTLPFAAVTLLAGALELRRRRDLSSWIAYGPALVGGFGPSVVLVLVGADPLWRWVTLFGAAIATVVIGSWRRRRAPVVTGAAVAVIVALVEMIKLLARGQLAGAILVAAAGGVLVAFGALSERRLRGAVRRMS